MSIQQEKFTAIANKIREKTGTTELIKPSDFANKIDDVYDAGKKLQYNEFWDSLQQNGNRHNYTGGFSGWSEDTFIPKYDMKPTTAYYMFSQYRSETDLVELLDNLGVSLDFSKCTDFTNFLLWSQIVRIGVVDSTSATSISFYVAYRLHTIDRLIIKNDGSTTLNFHEAGKLQNIVIEGIIGKSTNMQWSPLSKESFISVINALSNTTSKLTITFKKTAINDAFGINVDDETTYPEGSEFYNLRNSKSNWTFSFV